MESVVLWSERARSNGVKRTILAFHRFAALLISVLSTNSVKVSFLDKEILNNAAVSVIEVTTGN